MEKDTSAEKTETNLDKVDPTTDAQVLGSLIGGFRSQIVGTYKGGLTMGVIEMPNESGKFAVGLTVKTENLGDFPTEIEHNGFKIPIILKGNFQSPKPL